MRVVLIGSDFMYDKYGNLKPIEINTALAWDGPGKVEENVDCLDLTNFDIFIKSKNFTNIHYIGELEYLGDVLETYCINNSITFEYHSVGNTSITIPYIEDNETTLIIRSAYDTTALVDDEYCRDKVNFMNLIKNSPFASQFAYIGENNQLISNITTINDNGEHPNFILKSRLPQYDKAIYPKFFKVSTQSELDSLLNNITSEYFLMDYLLNTDFLWNGHSVVIRSLNILYPPNLESIQLGQYTKLNQNFLLDNITYDSTTFEVDEKFRDSYRTNPINSWVPKLLDTDMVELSDGTFKTALDLQVNDLIKTIDIPNENGVNIDSYISSQFGLTYETLLTSAVYSSNIVTDKRRVNTLAYLNELTFEDGSTWEDTMGSRYLTETNDTVKFIHLFDIIPGDVVLLIDTTQNDSINFVRKTVISNTQNKKVFSGWMITVDSARLFLTKTSSTNNESFVSIEHNAVPCPVKGCPPCTFGQCPVCPKPIVYCCSGTCSNAS